MKITPKAMLRVLDHDGLQQPQIKTLSNYLAIIRKDIYGPAQINVRDDDAIRCNHQWISRSIR